MSQDTTNEGGNLAALKRAAEKILTAIDAMKDEDPGWYGPFSESQDRKGYMTSVEWPDLNTLALQLREALKEVCDHHGALFDHPSGTGRCQCGATYHIATGWSKP